MTIKQAIDFLEKQIKNPKVGLPEEIFLFLTRLTPMLNVDLLIKDEKNRTLLSWRADSFHKPGWHIPGGIIRYQEKFEKRVREVAKKEIGAMVKFEPEPIALNEIILKQKNRGHFVSLLYKCFLPSTFVPKIKGLRWHETCPKNLIKVHNIYKKFI